MIALSIGIGSFSAVKGGRTVDVWIASVDGTAWDARYTIERGVAKNTFRIVKEKN